jgi:hypothetical protein
MLITGQEPISIIECAKIIVNEGIRINTAPIIVLGIIAIILYVALAIELNELSKTKKYLRQKNLLQDYTIWNFKRKEERR